MERAYAKCPKWLAKRIGDAGGIISFSEFMNLSLNDFELTADNELFADAVKDLVIGAIDESDFADLLYAQYAAEQDNKP